MREITITANDAGRRLDRFLRKYLSNASLGEIYKLIRKDIKVDGRRRAESYMLNEGETLTFYLSDEVLDKLTGIQGEAAGRRRDSSAAGRNASYAGSGQNAGRNGRSKAKRQFRIIFEDSNVLIASKPYGLLTHGDRSEKKNHLANQVKDYLIEQGEYDPRSEKVFAPAPANRLDRNTTGLVLFGKTSAALKGLNMMIRDDLTDKYYMTIIHGVLEEPLRLTGELVKDEQRNKVSITGSGLHDSGEGSYLPVVTEVRPVRKLDFGKGMLATLVEVKLVTGRSHQIRAHMAAIGHPVIGDSKYAHSPSDLSVAGSSYVQSSELPGRRAIDLLNSYLEQSCRLSTQLLHAYKICFAHEGLPEDLEYMAGKSFEAPLPPAFDRIIKLGSGRR